MRQIGVALQRPTANPSSTGGRKAEEARATTQYGDIKGTLAADGFDGIPIDDMYVSAPVPKGYQPIGMRIAGSKKNSEGELSIRASVLRVDTAQAGSNPDEIKQFGRVHGWLIGAMR